MQRSSALVVAGRKSAIACVIAALLSFTFLLLIQSGLGATDPNLKLAARITNQDLILGWFASNGIPYQVESSSNLTVWLDRSPVLNGSGALLFFTNIVGRGHEFYRVKRLTTAGLVLANFNPVTGILTITGDKQDNIITVNRDVAGNLRVNNGAVLITGGIPTVANTTLVQIFGGDGNDQLSMDEANGALPRAQMQGEAGNDTLIGGSGADVLTGGPGDDTLRGRGGSDNLLGGDDNDTVEGGDGNDIAALGSGDDRFVWNPGDDTDIVDGGDGNDLVEINGGNGAEQFTVTANGARVRFDRVDPAPFSLDIGTCETLVVNANGGDDTFSATGNLAALIQITVDGGPGNDTLLGSNGGDILLGGAGNDFVDGNQGNDVALLGADDDTFNWDPGDGNDTVEGQDGFDTLLFNGSNANEAIDVSANGARLRFLRNVGNIVMDCDDVERVRCKALGGTDVVTINDLSGTDVSEVSVDLSAIGGGGDAQADNVIVNGTGGADAIVVAGSSGSLSVAGLSATVAIAGSEAANDRITINALAGDDVVDASALEAGVIQLTADGGDDDDVLIGSDGPDVLLGGLGDDVLLGGPGVDVLDGGPGDNIIIQD